MPSSTLVLVYDAEDLHCRRLVDWITRRDRQGRVVTFPFQNGELVRVAPELAGLEFPGQVYSLDCATREVCQGSGILPGVLARLPLWAWLRGVAKRPGCAQFLFGVMGR